MAGLNLTLSLEDAGANALLDAVAHADTEHLLDEIGAYLDSQTQRRFQLEQGPDGEAWEPSARAQLQGGKTLQDSGRLAASITHNVINSGRAVEHGTNVIYAAIHQEGGVIQAKNAPYLRFPLPGGGYATVESVVMPARPFVGFGAEEEEDIPVMVIDWWQEAINAAGKG